MTKFASQTSVSVEKSKAEIESTVRRYGADSFVSGWQESKAMIQFRCKDRIVKFIMTLPNKDSEDFTMSSRGPRSPDVAMSLREQACRSKWRALALIIKAKLEAVESEIVSFDQEFLGHIVTPDGGTVYEVVRDNLRLSYQSGKVQPLLPDYSRPQ